MSQSIFNNGINGNHAVLLNILCQQRSGLNIVHFNARSLNGLKLDYAKSIFEKSKVDVFCVSETWFDDEISEQYYMISGYTLFQNSRKRREKKGGGVAIYCKNNLKARLVSKSKDTDVEFVNVEIYDTVTKILVSCVYNPRRINSLEPFFEEFYRHLIDYDHYITCGDFNVDLLIDDKYSEELTDYVNSVGLSIVNCQMPTRFSSNSEPSLLDLFIISDASLLLLFDQLSFVSDHDLLFCAIDVNLNRDETSRTITYRDYNSINYTSLFVEMSSLNLTDCWYQTTVDGKLDILLSTLQELYNRHVPIRSFSVKTRSCPWYNAAVKNAIRERNRRYDNWKGHRSTLNRSLYTRARNQATLVVRRAKMAYFSRKLDTSLPTSQLWRNIRGLGVHSRGSSECSLDPDELNDFFCADNSVRAHNSRLISQFYCNDIFQFSAVSEGDVNRAVMNVRSNAVGEDGVSIRFLRIVLPCFLGPLTHIFNHCITTSVFPTLWKIGRVTPVAKNNSASCPGDYRPISILSVLSKVLESLLSRQITDYLDGNGLLSPLQSGFRSGHSCTTAVLKVIDDLRPEYDAGNLSFMCFLDFSKAFDRVDHLILCNKLKYYFGFADTAVQLIEKYLSDRSQKVIVGGRESCLRSVTSGVPQGSVLGPLLFCMFVNDVFNVCRDVRIHAYADDIQLYISNRVGLLEDSCCRLNENLAYIQDWARSNNLMLNPNKSFVLPISRCVIDFQQFPDIYLGNTVLKFIEKAKYLGFYINSNLTCGDHVNGVIRNVFLTLRNLRLSSGFTPVEIKRKLVTQLIVPHITYSAEVYSKLDSHSLHKLQVSFNSATRYVYGLRRFDSVSSWRKMILGCDLVDYLRMRNLLFLHRLLYGKTPAYLYDKIVHGWSQRCLTLIPPVYSYLNTSRFFFINAIKLWNSLPLHLKHITGKFKFKKSLLDYILRNI